MFSYDIMTEEEAMQERNDLLKDGEYDAVIDRAEAKTSSSGNNMIELTLSVYDANGLSHIIRDYLVFTKKMMWKVIHCVNSAGLNNEYVNGILDTTLFVRKNVRVIIATKKGNEIPLDKLNGKALGSCYPSKNVVSDYAKDPAPQPKVEDDDLPF